MSSGTRSSASDVDVQVHPPVRQPASLTPAAPSASGAGAPPEPVPPFPLPDSAAPPFPSVAAAPPWALASVLTLASMGVLPPLAVPPWPRPPAFPEVPMGSTELSRPPDPDRSSRTHVCDKQTSPWLQRPPSRQRPCSV